MSSIPDSISTEKLEELHCDAIIEEILTEDSTPLKDKEWTPQDYCRIADEFVEKIEEYSDPMIDKMIIMSRIGRLMAFHSEMSTDIPESETIGKLCWARDAGKLQAIMCILDGICMGDNDFMYSSQHPEED
jgi:hypothetical protein